MLMMQVTPDEVVRVVAVRDRFVAAAVAVLVACSVTVACVLGRADVGIRGRHSDAVLVDMTLVRVVHVSVMQVVRVPVMRHRRVPAARTMLVIVTLVRVVVVTHGCILLWCAVGCDCVLYHSTGTLRHKLLVVQVSECELQADVGAAADLGNAPAGERIERVQVVEVELVGQVAHAGA